ncbi:MAG: hypothetical protein R3F61_32890 [Myxococcota bacterium]
MGLFLSAACRPEAEPVDDDCPAGEHREGETCVPHTSCEPGEHVVSEGSPTSDRECSGCTEGTFSVEPDAPECTAWTPCAAGFVESTPGTTTTDRACALGEPWSVDVPMDVYGLAFAGDRLLVSGDLPDASGRAYALDGAGTELWMETLGSGPAGLAYLHSVAVADDGSIVVAAESDGLLLHRLADDGMRIRTDLVDGAASLALGDVMAETEGVVVAGSGFPPGSGGAFGFMRQVLPDGSDGWSVTLSATDAHVAGLARGSDGALFMAGWSASQPVVRRYDGEVPEQTWSRPVLLEDVALFDLVAYDGGAVLAGGVAYGSGFVRRYASDGTEMWTHTVLAGSRSEALGVAVDAHGHLVVVGSTDTGLGQPVSGLYDGFVRVLDGDGTVILTVQTDHPLVEVASGASGWVYVAELAGDYYSEGPTTVWSHHHE